MKPLAQEILDAIKRGVVKGGEGSGNFGHSGRPGLVGGSASEGAEGAEPSRDFNTMRFGGKHPEHGRFALTNDKMHRDERGHLFRATEYLSPKGHEVLVRESVKSSDKWVEGAPGRVVDVYYTETGDKYSREEDVKQFVTDVYASASKLLKKSFGIEHDWHQTLAPPKKSIIGEAVERAIKGGAGSGSFGHAGRPGKVGGQAPHSSGGTASAGGAKDKPDKPDKPGAPDEIVKVLGNFTYDKDNDRFTWHGTVDGLSEIRDKAKKLGFELVDKVKEKLAEREAYKLTEEYRLKKAQRRRTLILIGTYVTSGPIGAAVVYYMMKDRDEEKDK